MQKLDGNKLDAKDMKSRPLPDEVRPVPARKNTRRWCRGKEGIEHRFHWQPRIGLFNDARTPPYEKVCSACGRKVDYCSAWSFVKKACRCGNHSHLRRPL